ncbi:MAG: hypothetical protein FWD57_15990 [Polyangiaceae bacterium]|nr:hypothetical protein [Polyangiaceae bacterium]
MSNSFTGERIVLMKPVAVVATLALVGLAMPGKSDAAVFADGTDLQAAKDEGLKLSASNNGPAAAVLFYTSSGEEILRGTCFYITSADGVNRTAITAGHCIVNALAVDPNAYAVIVNGSNAYTDRGVEIRVSASDMLLAPGCDGSLDKLDLGALTLSTAAPVTGQFVIGGSPYYGQQLTSVGAGRVLTLEQNKIGTLPPWDGGFNMFEGLSAGKYNDFLIMSLFFEGESLYAGFGAPGDSGSPVLFPSSIMFGDDGRVEYCEIVGVNNAYAGESSLYAPLYDRNSVAYQFVMDVISRPNIFVPESSTLGIGILGAAGLLLRRRHPVPSVR